ncbi:MAG: hypothetical protein ACYC9Y_07990 [Candidatus Methylomirabilia bacterium]
MPTLSWIGKEAVVNHHREVPFHLLKDVPELSSGAPGAGNLIVQGDNLVALKALLPYYAGQVKCVSIDPPYNTGNEGWVYNDNVSSPVIREWRGKLRDAVEMVRVNEQAFGASGEPRAPSPFELGLDFRVPRLSVREEQGLFEFEATHLLEHPWRLGEKDATLPERYDPRERPVGAEGFVDVGDGGRIVTGIAEGPPSGFVVALHRQVMLFTQVDDWTLERLVAWLDREIQHQDIPYGESAEFLRKAARGLMARCDIQNVGELALDRFRLRDELVTLICRHRDTERKAAFQTMLFPDAALVVDASQAVDFRAMTYEPSWLYEGGFQFRKHYFGPKPGELRERAPQSGAAAEEFLCAQHIDGLPAVRFWVRNLSRKESSFRLQTSTDWFYPDFVCKLIDGRILTVEYKGSNLYDTTDAEEKRAVGAVWAARSGGRCLFVMPTGRNFSVIDAAAGSVNIAPTFHDDLP